MTITFDALGVARDFTRKLADDGITEPFPVQELTIPDALEGRDVLGKAKTGSGKTLAFGLPLIERLSAGDRAQPKRPLGLVLAPTRELAKQVHDVLAPLAKLRDLSLVTVYGGTGFDKQIGKLRKGVDLVVATPGRLIDLIEQGEAIVDDLEVVVVDEADRMNDMGFRPQVEWILRRVKGEHQTLLFSARNSLVERFMTDPVEHSVEEEEPTVDAMEHRFIAVHQLDKPKLTAAIAQHHGRTLVFVRTKRGADRLAKKLRDEGVKVAAIHGDRTQAKRERALDDFAGGKHEILVATDVAARGIHVDDIDVVVHYDPPDDHKAYLHRSGRTARAGQKGLAVTLVLWDQHLEVRRLQRRLGIKELPIVEMLSNDSRLEDLVAWNPTDEEDAA